MLTVLIIRGATLSGAMEGVKFYMGTINLSALKSPNVSRNFRFFYIGFFLLLRRIQVWKEACTQVFYALSCCSGGLIAMASFNDFNKP